MYSTYEEECEAAADRPKRKIMVLGGGPNRIGQGIEFDYCCVHAALALREDGYETIMVNCNPETVSTDYDTSDRLYFEPLTLEDVLEIVDMEKPDGVIVQYGGQTPLKLARDLEAAGVPIIGTSPDIDRRRRGPRALPAAAARSSACGSRRTAPRAPRPRRSQLAQRDRLSRWSCVRSYVLGGRAMEIVHDDSATSSATCARRSRCRNDSPVLLDRFLERRDRGRRRLPVATASDVLIGGIMEHIEQAGVHSGDSACSLPPYSLSPETAGRAARARPRRWRKALNVVGLMNVQFAIQEWTART